MHITYILYTHFFHLIFLTTGFYPIVISYEELLLILPGMLIGAQDPREISFILTIVGG